MASRISPRCTAVAVVAIASFGGVAYAGGEPVPNFLMVWDASNDGVGPNEYNWTTFGNMNGYGNWNVGQPPIGPGPFEGFNYTGTLQGPSGAWSLEWNCVFNNNVSGVAVGGGAFVVANIVVTNTDPAVQNFSLLMTLPLLRAIPAPTERGSVVGTVTDLLGNGATVSAPAGSRIYTPRIDGVNEVPGYLMNAPFSQAAAAFGSAVVGPQSFGTPIPVAASQSADTSIAIFLSFDLTPGDSASFTSIFEVLVPGPGGLAVLAGLGLLRRRRR